MAKYSGFLIVSLVCAAAGIFFRPFGIISVALARAAMMQIIQSKELRAKKLLKWLVILALAAGIIEVVLLIVDFIYMRGIFKGLAGWNDQLSGFLENTFKKYMQNKTSSNIY